MIKYLELALIRFYQRAVSPGLPAACKYQPTCSRYAYEAIERFGVLRGTWLAGRRLARCVPWRSGGYDPVPAGNDDQHGHDRAAAGPAHGPHGEVPY